MKFGDTALEGDFRDNVAAIARSCPRPPNGGVQSLADWEAVAPFVVSDDHLVAAYNGVWTLLFGGRDVASDLYFRPALGAALAREHGTRVVSGFGYTVISSWGLRIHTPEGSRSFVVDQDDVVEQACGPPFGDGRCDDPAFDLFRVQEILWDLGIYTTGWIEKGHQYAAVRLLPG